MAATLYPMMKPGSDSPKKVALGNLISATMNLQIHIPLTLARTAVLGLPAVIKARVANYIPPTPESQDGHQLERLEQMAKELAGDTGNVVEYLNDLWQMDQANQETPIASNLFVEFLQDLSKSVHGYYNEKTIYDLFNVTLIAEKFKKQIERDYVVACGNTGERAATDALISYDVQKGLGVEFTDGSAPKSKPKDEIENAHALVNQLFTLLDTFIGACEEYNKHFIPQTPQSLGQQGLQDPRGPQNRRARG